MRRGDSVSVCRSAGEAPDDRVEALARLADGAGHDFNNLLTVMMLSLGYLEDAPELSPECRRATQDALRAAHRAAQLGERLRAFSRRQDLRPKAIDVREWLTGVEKGLEREVGPGVELCISSADDVWALYADPKALSDTLDHLAVNAREAVSATGAKLGIHAANAIVGAGPSAREYVTLTVSDNGCGMSEQTIEHAVEPFLSTKEPRTGHGLGLSIAYGFAKQSDGDLEIASNLGQGTVVTLYLPRATTQSVVDDAASDSRKSAAPPSRHQPVQ